MLHRQEQRLYYWLTRHQIGGPGAIVDLGAFAGGSTARLAQGLVDGGHEGVIHAYDRFTADPRTKADHLYRHGIAPFEGNDIAALARRLLAPWADRIRLHPGEIQDSGWNPGDGPIAVLVLDACKRTEWTDFTAASFYPHLVPGRSVIAHQDFLQWNQFWLPPHMALMGDWFAPLAYIPGTTVLWRCVARPDPAAMAARRVADLDDAAMIAAIEALRARFRGWGIGAALGRQIATIRANPGERRHWEMRPPRAD